MPKKQMTSSPSSFAPIYRQIRDILSKAREQAWWAVNETMGVALRREYRKATGHTVKSVVWATNADFKYYRTGRKPSRAVV